MSISVSVCDCMCVSVGDCVSLIFRWSEGSVFVGADSVGRVPGDKGQFLGQGAVPRDSVIFWEKFLGRSSGAVELSVSVKNFPHR